MARLGNMGFSGSVAKFHLRVYIYIYIYIYMTYERPNANAQRFKFNMGKRYTFRN